jgi:hypothetical protein
MNQNFAIRVFRSLTARMRTHTACSPVTLGASSPLSQAASPAVAGGRDVTVFPTRSETRDGKVRLEPFFVFSSPSRSILSPGQGWHRRANAHGNLRAAKEPESEKNIFSVGGWGPTTALARRPCARDAALHPRVSEISAILRMLLLVFIKPQAAKEPESCPSTPRVRNLRIGGQMRRCVFL